MTNEMLESAVTLAQKVGYVFIATADSQGMPHVTAAAQIASFDGGVAVTEWFCPGTVANLQRNKCVSIVIWAKDLDSGYQLIGRVAGVEDVGVLDGYSPAHEGKHPLPQVEKRLLVKVEKILDFCLGPHSDVED